MVCVETSFWQTVHNVIHIHSIIDLLGCIWMPNVHYTLSSLAAYFSTFRDSYSICLLLLLTLFVHPIDSMLMYLVCSAHKPTKILTPHMWNFTTKSNLYCMQHTKLKNFTVSIATKIISPPVINWYIAKYKYLSDWTSNRAFDIVDVSAIYSTKSMTIWFSYYSYGLLRVTDD